MPAISIIIATSSRPVALKESLHSLAAVQIPKGCFVELIVVENEFRSGVEGMVRELDLNGLSAVRYLFEPARGKSRALNLALSKASGEILLFSDDDVRFPSDWMQRMCEPILTSRADAVAGGVRLAPHLLRPWMNHTHRAWLASTADYLSPTEPSEMCGANMAISRHTLERIGGFDPDLGPGVTGGGEETILSWQIRKAGFRLIGLLDVVVEHHPDPERLLYRNWIKTAQLKGETRAYQRHHWFHHSIPFAYLKRTLVSGKLAIRRLISPQRNTDSEGIPPWELSYIEEIAMYTRFERERNLPRRYQRNGIPSGASENQ